VSTTPPAHLTAGLAPVSTTSENGALEVHDVRVHFAGVKAVDGVTLTLEPGQIVGLIGPNGAGKTTLVNVLSGFQRPTAGRVVLAGKELTGLRPDRFARRGVARTFQAVRVFPDLSVFENVEAGAVGCRIGRSEARALAQELIERLGLRPWAAMSAGALPHGAERRLGIARALASRPRFLLLDEPAAGLNEAESDELIETLLSIPRDFGCGVLLIEHEMRIIMTVSARVHVLDYGKTLCEGTPAEVRADPRVLEAYLGTGATHAAD
jgi:branched-chain amino acid transport system ATP-binding protein